MVRREPFEFDVNTSQAALLINNISVYYAQGNLRADLGLGRLETATTLDMIFINDGVVVLSQSANLTTTMEVALSNALTANTKYTVIAVVHDATGNEIARSPAYEFTYTPPLPSAILNSVVIQYPEKLDDLTQLQVFCGYYTGELLSGYELWIVDASGARIDYFAGQYHRQPH